MNSILVAGRRIGEKFPPVVIAEIGINHGGNLDLAISMAEAAINSGAEIVKHQTHVIEDEMSLEAKKIIPENAKESIYSIMEKCALDETDEYKLCQFIRSKGAIFISTPFSRMAVDRLARFDVPAIKIGSGECNNYPLIDCIVRLKKPVILSTGMNSIETILPSVHKFRANNIPYALLHCTNIYPTPPEYVRLGGLAALKHAFPDAVIGLSDHTVTNHVCFAGVALGASILERHFTDSLQREGPDIACSMDPEALADLVRGSRVIHKAMGGSKGPHPAESATIAFAFASVVALRDLSVGETLTSENCWVMRPGGGDFGAKDYYDLLGKSVIRAVPKGTQIRLDQLQSSV